MCGICGKVSTAGEVGNERLIDRMCAELEHRGPDGQGIHTAPHIGMGQRRLAIIDLDVRAVAPLANEDGSVWVTFNGEIYNFVELRNRLQALGHQFRTGTDTEVIVHLYEEYGTECIAKLHGMFALALWDSRKTLLLAARDRFGKKPLYYAATKGGLTFASEVASLLADPDISVAPNYAALDLYLALQYVPSPITAFEGISKLPAAHYLTWRPGDAAPSVRRYWMPPIGRAVEGSPEDLKAELVDRMRESVRRRLVSDVPLGAFLSGGVDSATVVAFMAQVSPRPVKTFSIGFEEETHNELPFARLVAERYATEHHEFIVKPDSAGVLPLLVRRYGEPFADSSALPSFHVARMTSQHVTVALSGDGGDETFAGYENYAEMLMWEARANAMPQPVRAVGGALSRGLDALPYSNTTARVSRGLYMMSASLPERYRLHTSILKPQERQAAFTPSFHASIAASARVEYAMAEWTPEADAVDWLTHQDQRAYLPDCLMVKTDIASMIHSLEVRCPFLDHELVEFAMRIPSKLKRTAQGGKQILKDAVAPFVPPEILGRRKTGFGVPLARWLRGDMLDLLKATLLDDRARRRNLLQPAFVGRMVEEHVAGRRDWSSRLWAFLWLELWFREFID